jgi:hypothetical protein
MECSKQLAAWLIVFAQGSWAPGRGQLGSEIVPASNILAYLKEKQTLKGDFTIKTY